MNHKTINKIIILEDRCLYSKNISKITFYPLNAYNGIYINNKYKLVFLNKS